MPEQLSKFEQLRSDAVDMAESRIVAQLIKDGSPEPRARAWVERNVEFLVDRDLRVHAKATLDGAQLLSRGTTREHLEHFARSLHLRFVDTLGGAPKPFGDEPPPPFEGAAEHDAKITAGITANANAMRDARRQAEETTRRNERHMAANTHQNAMQVDPRGAF